MNRSEARDIADAGLAHISGDGELIAAMLDQAGADASAIREMAARPEFSVFILDFLMQRDERLLAFADSAHIPPQRVQMARAVLGGAEW